MVSLTSFTYGCDVSILVFITSGVREKWNLTEVQYAVFPAVTGITNLLGAVWTSTLTDYFGRVWPYALTMAVIGVFGIADAFSPTYAVLIVLRCLASFGIGGIAVVSYPTFVEFLPRANRGTALVLANLFPAVGVIATTGLAWWLIPTYPVNGWRYFIFAVMIIPLLYSSYVPLNILLPITAILDKQEQD